MSDLVIGILAAFRLVRLFTFDAGPWDVFKRLRERAGIRVIDGPPPIKTVEERFLARLLDCYWCTGIWAGLLVAILMAFDLLIFDYFLFCLAVAGGASALDAILRSMGE